MNPPNNNLNNTTDPPVNNSTNPVLAPRKSHRSRHPPSRFIARPSKQGLTVEDGDAIFTLDHTSASADVNTTTHSKRVRVEESFKSLGGRMMPHRTARNKFTLSHDEYILPYSTTNNEPAKPPKRIRKQPEPTADKSSGAPRRPRVIVVGAGISGLACARELSERRHDVLVLEGRRRLGGRLRTVDLMMDGDEEQSVDEQPEGSQPESGESDHSNGSKLFNVQKWSPVDVGGAFIHGTGQQTTQTEDDWTPTNNVGSHDFGTSKKAHKIDKKEVNLRKSSRLSINYDALPVKPKDSHVNARKLNPVYVLAGRKLRLAVQAAEGAFTCLVDQEGDLISEGVDEEVSKEFNEVLDLATKCCESRMMPVVDDDAVTDKGKKKSLPESKFEGGDSPNYVSDDTAPYTKVDANPAPLIKWQKINPKTDFGTIFEHCKKYHRIMNKTRTFTPKEMQVRDNLFQWHVANLEMSSGAPMHKLGQRWNDDEPFGYGGDHSYLEGGFRDIIEALADGFDCRGVGDRSWSINEWVRRSGDLAGSFAAKSFNAPPSASQSRGIIQCGIEVNGIEVVEKGEAKMLRKMQRGANVDVSKCRRSSRKNRGSKMSEIMGSLTTRQPAETLDYDQTESQIEYSELPKSTYGNEESTVVRVTTVCGLTFEADAVVVTLPLAILSIPRGLPGHVKFSPPLSTAKRNALRRLGVGTYNKCCMSFSRPFWKHLPRHLSTSSNTVPTYWNDPTTHRFDFIGHASNEHGKDILFFNIRNAPILVAIYGGSDYSTDMENLHDREVVAGCMKVLKKIFSKAASDCRLTRNQINDLTVPDWPIDYFVSRWGSDPFSRGAFSYVPKGVDGYEELKAMSQPMYDYRPEGLNSTPQRPLVLFAGEGTTPFHPSTIHGAFETGIREAYRLDFSLEPGLNPFKFNESYLYQHTFSVRPAVSDTKCNDRNGTSRGNKSEDFSAIDDASILRGVETFSLSSSTFDKIRDKMLNPENTSATGIKTRFNSLMNLVSEKHSDGMIPNESRWDLPGGKGETWLAPNSSQPIVDADVYINHINSVSTKTTSNTKAEMIDAPTITEVTGQSRSGRKIQRRTYTDCVHYS